MFTTTTRHEVQQRGRHVEEQAQSGPTGQAGGGATTRGTPGQVVVEWARGHVGQVGTGQEAQHMEEEHRKAARWWQVGMVFGR